MFYLDGCLGFFQDWVIRNKVVMNISFTSLLWIDIFISLDKYLGVELLSHRVDVCLTLLKNCPTVFQSG